MNKKEIIFLSTIPLLVIIFFLIATPLRGKSEKAVRLYSPVGWENAVDNPSKKISIRCASTQKQGTTSWKQKMLDERFNIETEYMYLSPEAMPQKLPLMLAAGDIPDYFSCGRNQMVKYAQHGFIMEIPYELLLKHAPNIVKQANKYCPNSWLSLSYQGGNYAIPFVWPDGMNPRPGLWRKDWLEKVGIHKVPETLDEYHEALWKFRNEDPDGNGVRDTYGMSGNILAWHQTFTEIFGAFGVMPYNWMDKDGKVVWGGIQPEAKQALELLSRWCREELIHPDFMTDRSDNARKFYNGRIGYLNYSCCVAAFNLDNPSSIGSLMKKLQPGSEIIPGRPPFGPDGKCGHRVWGAIGYIIVLSRNLVDQPEKLIRILRMLDEMSSDESLAVEVNIGRRSVHWDWADPVVGQGSGIKMIPPFDQKNRREEEGFRDPTLLLDAGDPGIFEKYLPKSHVEFNRKYRKVEWGRADIFNWNDAISRSDEFLPDLIHLQQKYYAEIISGKRPISDFDEFVAKWRKQGGDILLAEAQKLWDSRREIFKKLGMPDERR